MNRWAGVFWDATAWFAALVMVASLTAAVWLGAERFVQVLRLRKQRRTFRRAMERDRLKAAPIVADPATYQPVIGSLDPRPDCPEPGCVLTMNHPGTHYMDHHLPGAPDVRLCTVDAACTRPAGHPPPHRTRHRDRSVRIGPSAEEIIEARRVAGAETAYHRQRLTEADDPGFRQEVDARQVLPGHVPPDDVARLQDWVRRVTHPN